MSPLLQLLLHCSQLTPIGRWCQSNQKNTFKHGAQRCPALQTARQAQSSQLQPHQNGPKSTLLHSSV